jgi:hypothetical protein
MCNTEHISSETIFAFHDLEALVYDKKSSGISPRGSQTRAHLIAGYADAEPNSCSNNTNPYGMTYEFVPMINKHLCESVAVRLSADYITQTSMIYSY